MARINAISTALPSRDVEHYYRSWARERLADSRLSRLYDRMASRSGIEHRWSVLPESEASLTGHDARNVVAGAFSTADRMERYAREAPKLALSAIRGLPCLDGVSHLVVASCTGFCAPGIDQIVARELGLSAEVERVFIGFMGCYAGITALRTARHIVRSTPEARVLVVAVELCTLHVQPDHELEPLLAMGQFGDGAAAALITAGGDGLSLDSTLSATLEDSAGLITWTITDTGFVMHLSGEVPGRIATALSRSEIASRITEGQEVTEFDAWAVHPGGRSILDAVDQGLALPQGSLAASRSVLRDCGNVSSATVLFVLERLMPQRPKKGVALAFGPGLAMEGLRFSWAEGDAC